MCAVQALEAFASNVFGITAWLARASEEVRLVGRHGAHRRLQVTIIVGSVAALVNELTVARSAAALEARFAGSRG